MAPPRASTRRCARPNDPGGGVRRVRAAARWRQGGQRAAPGGGQRGEVGRAQGAGQPPLLGDAPLGEVVVERCQVGRVGGGQLGRRGGEAEQVDVEIAGRRGEIAQPLELGPVLGGQAVRAAGRAELERGPGPAHRDPQVMQELGVDVADRARDVRLQRVEQPQQHGRERRPGGHPRPTVPRRPCRCTRRARGLRWRAPRPAAAAPRGTCRAARPGTARSGRPAPGSRAPR